MKEFNNLKTDITKLSIGTYDQICKSGNLRLLVINQDTFDREFKLSVMDKISEVINSKRSFFGKIRAFFCLMIGVYNHSKDTITIAKQKHLEKAFDYIDTQIFNLRGISSEMLKKKRLMEQIINLRSDFYVDNNTFASNRLRQLERQLKELEKKSVSDYSVSKMCIIFTNELGFNFQIDEFKTNIVKFFEYSDILTEKRSK